MYNNLERRSNIWGLGYDQRTKFVQSAGARDVRSGQARRAGVARLRRLVRRRLPEVAAVAVRASCARSDVKFGVLSKERCTGDPAKRTGNEYMFQELANAQHRGPEGRRPEEDPHVVPALREDDRRRLPEVRLRGRDRPLVGVRRGADARRCGATASAERSDAIVTFHDPCYLGRYAGKVDEPRALLDALRRRHQGARAQPRQPVLLRRRRRPAVRRQGRGARHRASATSASSSCRRPAPTPSSPPARSARSC